MVLFRPSDVTYQISLPYEPDLCPITEVVFNEGDELLVEIFAVMLPSGDHGHLI